jgi:3-methyladenine DNA glycosylase/8-oxoguanine DNA glycosylase
MAELPFDWDEALGHLGRTDRRFAPILARGRAIPLEIARLRSPFEYLLKSVIYQQLSGKAAATIHRRCLDLFPRRRPEPARLLAIRAPRLRAAGVSAGKQRALRDLARRALAGEVPGYAELGRMTDDAIIERLTKIHGVGRWTAEMLLIFQLGRPDVLPVGDLGVRKGFARLAGREELPSPSELASEAEAWRPYRTVGSWCCWRAL